jgi:hypothetical protein
MKVSILEGFAGQSVRLAVLPILLVGLAGISQAQATGAAAPSTTKAAPAAAPATSGAHSRGTREGIKVHGHWTIEVRNPDGKVVTHREFENSLVTGGGPQGGADLLTTLLGRTVVTGPWLIALGNNLGTGSPLGGSICPTNPGTVYNFNGTGECLITEANSTWTLTLTTPGFPSEAPACPPGTPGYCYTSLSLSTLPCGVASTCATPTLSLTGNFVATQAGSISYVGSAVYLCIVNVTTPPNPVTCLTQTDSQITRPFEFTTAGITPVPVGLGQQVVATVTFSFN